MRQANEAGKALREILGVLLGIAKELRYGSQRCHPRQVSYSLLLERPIRAEVERRDIGRYVPIPLGKSPPRRPVGRLLGEVVKAQKDNADIRTVQNVTRKVGRAVID